MRLTPGLYSLSVVGWTILNKDLLNRPNRFSLHEDTEEKLCKIDTWAKSSGRNWKKFKKFKKFK